MGLWWVAVFSPKIFGVFCSETHVNLWFKHMDSESAANEAISTLHLSHIDGGTLTVEVRFLDISRVYFDFWSNFFVTFPIHSSIQCKNMGKKFNLLHKAAFIPLLRGLSINWVGVRSTDWLIDWVTGWLIDWLSDWWIDWLIESLVDWLSRWLIDWFEIDSSRVWLGMYQCHIANINLDSWCCRKIFNDILNWTISAEVSWSAQQSTRRPRPRSGPRQRRRRTTGWQQ